MQALMVDIKGQTLAKDDEQLLGDPSVAGVILFGRNCTTPNKVRALTDSIRTLNPNLVICIDQEGGRVARLRTGFTPLPAMGQIGKLYDEDNHKAEQLAYAVGYVMACEVLAVGIDLSFAPVLDIDNESLVIGDRAFHQSPKVCQTLAHSFIKGMNRAGMSATGKHFPGHGSVVADSHVADVVDNRDWQTIWQTDLTVFSNLMPQLSAIMPAHVVYPLVDDKPAGFSKIWLQDILRQKMGFDGVIFSDDLSMKAAKVAGGVGERVAAAVQAGCDVVLVCNDRAGAWQAVSALKDSAFVSSCRMSHIKSVLPSWQGDLTSTCQQFEEYQQCHQKIAKFIQPKPCSDITDPTDYA